MNFHELGISGDALLVLFWNTLFILVSGPSIQNRIKGWNGRRRPHVCPFWRVFGASVRALFLLDFCSLLFPFLFFFFFFFFSSSFFFLLLPSSSFFLLLLSSSLLFFVIFLSSFSFVFLRPSSSYYCTKGARAGKRKDQLSRGENALPKTVFEKGAGPRGERTQKNQSLCGCVIEHHGRALFAGPFWISVFISHYVFAGFVRLRWKKGFR